MLQTEPTPPITNFQSSGPEKPMNHAWFRNKKLLIALAVLVILILGLVLLRAHNLKQRESKNPASDTSIYHFRPGYDIKEYGSGIGDPLALDMSKLDQPERSSIGLIVYACNVVTTADINSQKIYLTARADDRAVIRNFIDGVGKLPVRAEPYSVTGGDKGNSCSYSLQSGGILSISVYQPPFNSTDAVQDLLGRRYTKTASIGGLQTYKRKDGYRGMYEYMILSGRDAISVQFNGTKLSDAQKQAVLSLAAQNFASQQKHGKGPAIPAYNSPTYTKKWARACDFISNADIKNLTGTDASIYANEGLASGTGVERASGKLYNFITTSCSRFNTDLGSGLVSGPFDQKLDILITSYQEATPATVGIADTRKNAQNAVTASIGDEGIAYKDSAGQNTVLFRQGRFIVQLVFDRVEQSNAGLADTNTMVKKLAPYAQSVATKLKILE